MEHESASGVVGQGTVDVKVTIPEMDDLGAFWLRGYPGHYSLKDLYLECVNHPDVRRSSRSLDRVRASRHFWVGDRMLLEDQPVTDAVRAGEGLSGNNEVSLVLRRDYYRLSPPQFVTGGREYNYLIAEAPIGEIVEQVLTKDESPCCFDMCDSSGRRLSKERSLTDYGLYPAWEDADGPFPARAALLLKPRISAAAYLIMAVVAVVGFGIGFALIRMMLRTT